MQRLVFSTEGVPEREQFERHLLSPRWERGGPSGAPFHGAMTVRQLGEARFVDLRSQPHRVLSGQAEAARAAAGVCVVQQEFGDPVPCLIGRRPLVCRAGDLVVHGPDARLEEDGPRDWGRGSG